MLLANQESAKRVKYLGIFRVHQEPTTAKIKKLIDDVKELGIKVKFKNDVHFIISSIQTKAEQYGLEEEVDELIIQSQQQAKYSSIKQPHFGLGFENYSHFTSPIRRYSDLILHRILKTADIPQDIEKITEEISETERKINSLVWDYEARKYCRFLKNYIGKFFNAIVVDRDEKIVKIVDKRINGARVYIENYSGEKLFLKVKIKIISSDLIQKEIIGEISNV